MTLYILLRKKNRARILYKPERADTSGICVFLMDHFYQLYTLVMWYIDHIFLIFAIKETQSNLSQVSIECIDKVIQNALIFYAR